MGQSQRQEGSQESVIQDQGFLWEFDSVSGERVFHLQVWWKYTHMGQSPEWRTI